MSRPSATIIFVDAEGVIVICPFCLKLHKHGATMTTNESRSSHCLKGEYILGEVMSEKDVVLAIEYRQREQNRLRARTKKDKNENSAKLSE